MVLVQRGVAVRIARGGGDRREDQRRHRGLAAEEVVEVVDVGIGAEARIVQEGQVVDVPADLPRLGDRRPVVARHRVGGGGVALGEAHAEAQVLQEALVLELVAGIALPGLLGGLGLVLVLHREGPVVVGRIDQRRALRIAEDQLRPTAAQVDGFLRHLHAGGDGGVEAVGGRADVLQVRREGPLFIGAPVQLPGQVLGLGVAIGAAGVGAEVDAGAIVVGQRAVEQLAVLAELAVGDLQLVGVGLGEDGALVPLHPVLAAEVGQAGVDVVLLPLQRAVQALALAVEFQRAPLRALRDPQRRVGILADHRVGARVVGLDLEGVGAGAAARAGDVDQRAELAQVGLPAVAHHAGDARRGFLLQVRVGGLQRQRCLEAVKVERHRGAQVHEATDRTFDLLGGGVLVDVDRGHQFGRHVLEVERAAAVGGERIAAVHLGADIGQAADADAGAFDREVLRVALGHGAVHGDADDALQHLGDRAVGQLADVVGDDGIDDLVGVLLDLLGRAQRGALARDDDGLDLGLGLGVRLGGGRRRRLGEGDAGGQATEEDGCLRGGDGYGGPLAIAHDVSSLLGAGPL